MLADGLRFLSAAPNPAHPRPLPPHHPAHAAEREFLVSLFGEDPGPGEALAERSASGEYGGVLAGGTTIPQLLDSVFESIGRPLKVRC